MRQYTARLIPNSRRLRREMTDAERILWRGLRGKQIHGLRFRRQRPIGPYIVDFYCPAVRLVVEVDGGQHFEQRGLDSDREREVWLAGRGMDVLRFDNLQVLRETEAVLEAIWSEVGRRIVGRGSL